MRVALWVLLWVLLLAASAGYLWRRLRALGSAAARLGAQLGETERLVVSVREAAGPAPPPKPRPAPLAVFVPVRQARSARRTLRRAAAENRQARRRARLPVWAHAVDWTGPDRERHER